MKVFALLTRILPLLLIGTLSTACSLSSEFPTYALKVPPVTTALSWLPKDTETVQVYQDFVLPTFDDGPFEETIAADNASINRSFWSAPIDRLLLFEDDHELFNSLSGQRVTLAVEGSWNFRPPNGESFTLYDGCHILLFKSELPDKFLGCLSKMSAKEIFEYNNLKVRFFDTKTAGTSFPLYICLPANNVLLIATSKRILFTVIDRLNNPQSSLAHTIPDTWIEWKFVNTTQKYWAIRHMQQPWPNDLLSMIFSRDRGFFGKKPTGVVAQLNGPLLNSLTLTVLGTDPSIADQSRNFIRMMGEDEYVHPSSKKISANAWCFSIQNDDALCRFLWAIDAFLGHAIYP